VGPRHRRPVAANADAGGRIGIAVSVGAPLTPARIDGRRLRSERTKQTIIEAYLALLRENPQVPTAAQIAARAGYSVRSIFERFPDLLSLRIAATDYVFAVGNSQAAPQNVDGDRPTRLRSQVETRARTCERWLPLWRALNANQGESTELKMRIRLARDLIMKRLELMYQPELSTLSERDRKRTLIALEALTDFESWARMRDLHGLSFEQGCALWVGVIDRLLPPPPAVS
jgi:AcrR family transcriptional regulator